MKIRAIVFVALVVMSIAPRHVSAQAIGISSSTYSPVIYRGDVLHEEFVLSRSEPGGDLLFHVQEEEESGLIDLHGQDSVTILNGENTAVFSYDINASAVAIGEYDTTITFVVVPQEEELDDTAVAIQFGLKVELHISVVERPDPSVTISLPDYPTLIDEVYVGAPTMKQASENGGTRLTMTWDVENRGMNPLTEIPTGVVVTQDGMTQYQEMLTVHDVVPPGGASTQTAEFVMSGVAPSGTYTATVKVGTHENQENILVLQPRIKNSLLVIALSITTVVAITFFYKQKRATVRR